MAKFGEKLFEFREIKKFFRIPVSCSVDKNFLNVGKNSVVKVHDDKALHTWTLMHPHHFTCPVVYSEENIYSVMDNDVLIRWDIDEENLTNAKKIQFQESIFVVIPMIGRLLILFNSGKYAIVDATTFKDFKLLDFIFLKENEELVWADACRTTKVEIFCIVQNKKTQENIAYNFTISEKDEATSNLCVENLLYENETLKSWCINRFDCSLVTFWSDGTIISHNVKDSKDSKLLSIKNISSDALVAIETVDPTHIVVASGCLKQKECTVEIWDTKCLVLKAKRIIKTSSLSYIQIAVMQSKIFLSYNEELVSVSFLIENPTFCAAIGKSLSKNNEIVEYSWGSKTELLPVSPADEIEVMEVCDQDQTNNVDTIEAVAHKLLNDLKCIQKTEEADLVKLLQLAIRYKKEESLKEKAYSLLNIIFSASFNDAFLMKYLKRLNSDEAAVAIEFLLAFLEKTVEMPSNIDQSPSDIQIVNWAFLIIQCHVQNLLLSKDKSTKRILRDFKKTLSIKMEEYEDYECIKNYFSIIEKKRLLPEKCTDSKYTVENLDI